MIHSQELKIPILVTLDPLKSVAAINQELLKLEVDLNKLRLFFDVDPKELQSLSKQVQKHKKSLEASVSMKNIIDPKELHVATQTFNQLSDVLQTSLQPAETVVQLSSSVDSVVQLTHSLGKLQEQLAQIQALLSGTSPLLQGMFQDIAVNVASSVISDTLVNNLKNISKEIPLIALKANLMTKSMGVSSATARVLTLSTAALTVSLRALASSFLPLAAIMGVSLAIEGLISLFGKQRKKQEELEESNRRLKEEQELIASNWGNEQEKIQQLTAEYKDLNSIREKTAEEEQRYLQVSNQLAALIPNLVDHIDDQGQAHLKSASAIQEELEYAEKLHKLHREAQLLEAPDTIKSFNKDIAETEKKLKALEELLDKGYYEIGMDIIPINDKKINELKINALELEQEIKRATQDKREFLIELAQIKLEAKEITVDENIDSFLQSFFDNADLSLPEDKLEQMTTDITQFIRSIQRAITSDNVDWELDVSGAIRMMEEQYPQITKELYKFEKALREAEEATKQMQNALNDGLFEDIEGQVPITSIEHLNQLIKNGAVIYNKLGQTVDQYGTALKNTSDLTWESVTASELLLDVSSETIKQMKQAIEVVTILSQMENLNAQQKQILAGATEYLESLYPHLSGNIQENIGFLYEEMQVMELLGKQSGDTTEALIKAQDDATLASLKSIDERINGYGEEIEALKKLQLAMTTGNDLQIDPANWEKILELSKQINDAKSNLAGEYEARRNLLYGSGIIEKPKSKTEKEKKVVDPYEIIEYTQSMNYYDTQIKLIDGQMSRLSKTSDEYSKALNEQIYLLDEKQKKMSEERKSIDAQIAKLQEQLTVTKDIEKQNEMKKQIESLTSTRDSLKTGWWDIDEQKHSKIFERRMLLFNQLSKEVEEYDHNLSVSQAKMSKYEEGTEDWNKELLNQNKIFQDKRLILLEQIDVLEKLLATGRLFPDQEEEVQKQLRKTKLEYENLGSAIDGFIDTLNKQMDIDLSALTEKYEKLNKELEKLLNPTATFDYRQFHQAIVDIVATLDSIDERYLQGVSFIDTSNSARSNLSSMKQDILDIARTVESMASKTSNNAGQLESIIRNQINYAHQLKNELDDVNNTIRERQRLHRQEEEALQNQIKLVGEQYDKQIEAQKEKLKALDEEIQKEDRLQKLRDINDEIDKVKKDERKEFITEDGRKILTYDKARVKELENQRDEMLKQFEREDIKKAINDEIDRLQKLKEDTLKELNDKLEKTRRIHQAEIDSLRMYADNLSQLHSLVVADTQEKMSKLKELQEQEKKEYEEHWKDLIEKAKDGTLEFENLMNTWQNTSLNNLNEYVDGFGDEVTRLSGIIASMRAMATEASSISASVASSAAAAQSALNSVKSAPKGTSAKTGTSSGGLKKFHSGGIVGGSSNKLIQLANEIFNAKPGETVIKSLVGELQIPPNNIKDRFIPNMRKIIESVRPVQLGSPIGAGGDTVYHLHNVTIQANNPSEFMKGLDFTIKTKRRS